MLIPLSASSSSSNSFTSSPLTSLALHRELPGSPACYSAVLFGPPGACAASPPAPELQQPREAHAKGPHSCIASLRAPPRSFPPRRPIPTRGALGTAKTTICEAFARYLGWSFVQVDTSAFLADGLSNVASRISYVFDRLLRLERAVILFDEIEEFCLDRETPGLGEAQL